MQPMVGYATLDGLSIATQTLGAGPPDLVFSAGSYNHAEVLWEEPAAALFMRRLAGFSRLIRFDMLGAGGSDRMPTGTPRPSFSRQLDAVLEEATVGSFATIAMLDATPGAIRYVVDNPDRVSHLIIYTGTARLLEAPDYPIGLNEDAIAALTPLFESEWGSEAMARLNVPSRANDARFVEWYSKYLRSIGTPTEIRDTFAESVRHDVRDLLDRVTAPTLVMHRAGHGFVPRTHGEYLAEHIPGAEFVEVPGRDGPVFWEAPDSILNHIEGFLRGSRAGSGHRTQVLTLLFTDIVRSTEHLARLGDRDWSAVLAQHDEICGKWTQAFNGSVVKGTGDGMLASFESPSDAVRAASGIRDELAAMSVDIRCGVHVGEVDPGENDVAGLAVHVASRIMDAADGGEILVSRTVRDLVAGSSITFVEAGTHELKGVAEPWQLYRYTG